MDDIIKDLTNLISKAEFTSTELKKVDRVLSEADRLISNANQEIEQEIRNAPINARQYAKEAAIEQAPKLFRGEVEDAINKNDEFAYYAFINPLFEISEHDDLYSIIVNGNGWNSTATVSINMNDVAGNIEEYAQAVESVRDNLGVGQGDPEKASAIWRTKIYGKRGGNSAYGLTISDRLSSSSSPAPFWSLLNDGNKVNMSSDRGGTAYPNRAGTHFVEKAESLINNEFRFQMSNLKVMSESYISRLTGDMIELTKLKDAMEKKIHEIEIAPEKMDVIARELGVDREKLSSQKLYRAKKQLESGELRSQYYIGAPGYSKRVRPGRLRSILSTLGD